MIKRNCILLKNCTWSLNMLILVVLQNIGAF